jgi:hypothetical protein
MFLRIYISGSAIWNKTDMNREQQVWKQTIFRKSLSFCFFFPSLEINSHPFALCSSRTSQISYRRHVSILYKLIHVCVPLLLPVETIHWPSLSILETSSRLSTLQSRNVSLIFLYSRAYLFKCVKYVLQIQVYIVSVKERLPKCRCWRYGVPVIDFPVVRASCLCKKRRPFVLWRVLVFGSMGLIENKTSYHLFTTIARH